jgi:hypothetical protein
MAGLATFTLLGAAFCGSMAVLGFLFPGMVRQNSRRDAFLKFTVVGAALFIVTLVAAPNKNNEETVKLKIPAIEKVSLQQQQG